MREVVVTSTGAKLAQQITIGPHHVLADEEIEKGGTDTGPEPHELLLAALGVCTSMTLRLYADRKGWPLQSVRVTLGGATEDTRYAITRRIILEGDLDSAQRQRLIEIANKCPVHRTLTGEVVITTREEGA